MFATAMLAAPVLLIAGTAVEPAEVEHRVRGSRQAATDQLTVLAGHRPALAAAAVLLTLGLAALIPAMLGAAALVTARGRRWARIGAALVTIGAPAGAASNAASILLLYHATSPDVDPTAAVAVRIAPSGPADLILFALYALMPIGMILISIGLYRSQAVPRWAAALTALGTALGFLSPAGPIGATFTLPLLASLAIIARRHLQPA
jgi:hypothetical protein